MRTSIDQFEQFYNAPLGQLIGRLVSDKLVQAWGTASRLKIAGFGYTSPFLGGFSEALRRLEVYPHGMGVSSDGGASARILADDHAWPLSDGSLDRIVILHGLEEVAGPRRFLREVWRVLKDDGLIIVASANRRGPWAMVETSPFAAGRPYSRRQLDALLKEVCFQPTAHATALHFPPMDHMAIRAVAPSWEKMGETLERWPMSRMLPNIAGLNLVEARKSQPVPVSGSRVEVFRPGILLPGRMPQPARFGPRETTTNAASAVKLARVVASGEKDRG